jgi:CDP-diacylglycerol---glycerol-3-phosphate 3-phosphatidyltransferase
MSWPHFLSFSRVLASPFIAALILAPPGDAYLIAAIVFTLASITDLLDGKLARQHAQQESPLGVFLDTTADKVMVSLALLALAIGRLSPGWIPLVIIGREFLISGLRSFAASCNRIISAHIWGKGKAAITMVAIICMLLAADGRSGGLLARAGSHRVWADLFGATVWLLAVSAVLTILSGARYLVDARSLLQPQPAATESQTETRPRKIAGIDG